MAQVHVQVPRKELEHDTWDTLPCMTRSVRTDVVMTLMLLLHMCNNSTCCLVCWLWCQNDTDRNCCPIRRFASSSLNPLISFFSLSELALRRKRVLVNSSSCSRSHSLNEAKLRNQKRLLTRQHGRKSSAASSQTRSSASPSSQIHSFPP